MIDIDGTLVGADYCVTDPGIYAAVESAQREGWTIGLSSDTPYETIVEWRSEFGMNGPIIAEKGAHVVTDDISVVTRENEFDFVSLRDRFLSTLAETDTVVYKGNAIKVLREGVETIGEPGDEVILVNVHRQQSLGYFARRAGEDGALLIDKEQTLRFATLLRELYPANSVFDEDLNLEHGLLIVSHKGMHKRVGTLALQNHLGIQRIAMIGNSIADYVGRDIASHLAVGDATEAFQRTADYVADAHLTSGVIEALDVLVKHNR